MSAPSLDVEAFVSRLERLYRSWEVRQLRKKKTPTCCWCALIRMPILFLQSPEDASQWGDADALAVVVGKDDVIYSKSTALHVCISLSVAVPVHWTV